MMISEIAVKNNAKYLNMFCEYLYKNMGIQVEENKKNLLLQKILKLMDGENITDIAQYYHFVASPPITEKQRSLQNRFVDIVTIHKTGFFRENNHFIFIKNKINEILEQSPTVKLTKEIRIWSSACSTGEEAYTLAMLFKELLPPDIKPKILATDISPDSIKTALNGAYKFNYEDDNMTKYYIRKYFDEKGNHYVISDEIKSYVTFRLFNLMENFPFKNPFDIIFCRNVMIYFSKEVQEKLIGKFYDSLTKNGLLFIGHSESLIQVEHKFNYYNPTIYKK